MYTCVLELGLTPAAYCKSIPRFYNNIVFLYNFVRYLYTFTPYIKRIILEQHEWDTFMTLTVLG